MYTQCILHPKNFKNSRDKINLKYPLESPSVNLFLYIDERTRLACQICRSSGFLLYTHCRIPGRFFPSADRPSSLRPVTERERPFREKLLFLARDDDKTDWLYTAIKMREQSMNVRFMEASGRLHRRVDFFEIFSVLSGNVITLWNRMYVWRDRITSPRVICGEARTHPLIFQWRRNVYRSVNKRDIPT